MIEDFIPDFVRFTEMYSGAMRLAIENAFEVAFERTLEISSLYGPNDPESSLNPKF